MENQEGFQMGALQPFERKTVDFMGAQLLAVKDDEGQLFAGVKWICEGLGLSEGQIKNERKRLREDLVLSKGGRNFVLPTTGGQQEVMCIELDYLPLWLAKISITPRMQEETPWIAESLVGYQLKAKDVLAEAFLKKQQLPSSPIEIAKLTLEGLMEQEGRLGSIEKRMDDYELHAPILPQQAESITALINKKVYSIINANYGGNKSVSTKLFARIGRDIKKAFGVNKRAMIAKKDFDRAVDFVRAWEPDSVTRYQLQLDLTDQQIVANESQKGDLH